MDIMLLIIFCAIAWPAGMLFGRVLSLGFEYVGSVRDRRE